MLARLTELEIFTWSYRDDPDDARHVGPVAEDFYQRFGFGHDDKHISP
ncbi:MAG: tail fiber domain-containing protein, partial [bacterium]|nr:tail fiber domain-containing protein [bacterium]